MSTPDELAATLPPSTWKDRPLPVIGHKVRINFAAKRDGRTRWELVFGRVAEVSQPSDTGLVIKLNNAQSYLIDSTSMLDDWAYVDPGDPDREPQPVAIDPSAIEHENRLATDPVYRHHWETITESIALKTIQAEQEDEANPFGPDLSGEPEENTPDGLPDPYAETLAARMRRLEFLDDQIKSLKAQAEGLQAEYEQLCAIAMEQMSQEGVPSITVDGNTWYMKAKTFVEKLDGVTTEDIREALVASGYGSMISETYNSQSLRSLLTEFRDSDGQIPIPEALAKVVRLGQTTMIGRTRAAARKRRAPLSPTP